MQQHFSLEGVGHSRHPKCPAESLYSRLWVTTGPQPLT